MGGVYETPLRQWRRIMRPGRTERRARSAGSITGVAVLSAAERRRFDEDAARVAELRRSGQLTPREREVMELLDIGLTAHETALVLEVNPRAVAHHLENVLELLGAPTRAEALTRFRAWEPAQQAR
jgi:DNA-binding CsgD family transcriptional regulator